MNIILVGERNKTNITLHKFLASEREWNITWITVGEFMKAKEPSALLKADVILADLLSLPSKAQRSIELLRQQNITGGLIVFHFYQSRRLVQPLLDAGVNGYLVLPTSESEIADAIHTVAQGGQYVSEMVD